ncbi:DM13 domain-containing protein [Parerythrobacter jejuensis]|uniref:DM13 domain-containing protein n=1 Tax=Parerythrobacter jejuensis TaxID=795812 RepID=A0A845AP20_9SPHN|nr:DM13 domain-containing protein [Parerythrobacter jejuensis]MXP32572.1 hypothetical protein [Parerythrobacter jejuensis]
MLKLIRTIAAPVLLATTASTATLGLAFVGLPSAAVAAEASSAGEFRGADSSHPASGNVEIVKLKGGGLGVKLKSNFKVRGGPDLRVWLSEARNPRNGRAVRQAGYVDLGRLKSSSGEQIYRIPASANVTDAKSVVIWCRAFGVFFGSATVA